MVEGGAVEAEVGVIHYERGARLATESWLDTSDAVGHQPEHWWRYMFRSLPATGGCLDGFGEVVERKVVGPADLEDLAAGGRVDDGVLDHGRDVGD
jgi:hypothetical protein